MSAKPRQGTSSPESAAKSRRQCHEAHFVLVLPGDVPEVEPKPAKSLDLVLIYGSLPYIWIPSVALSRMSEGYPSVPVGPNDLGELYDCDLWRLIRNVAIAAWR